MSEVTQPGMARGTKLTAAVLASALCALLAFAPFASAAPDPVGSGTTTVTLNKGFVKSLKNKGVTIQKIAPAKLKGNKVTFSVTGGSIDPLTGQGTLNLGGGLKFKAGKKSAPVKGLVMETTKSALTGKIGGKKTKLASLKGLTFVRNGFGLNVTVKQLKLTGAAASALNKKLGTTKPKAFTGNKKLGSAKAESQPATTTVLPGGNVTFTGNAATLEKLAKVEVKIETIPPTASPATGLFQFPITGGTISPAGTAGVVQSGGGLKLVQTLPTGPETSLKTEITLGGFFVDLSAKTTTVEVVATSNASNELNLGNLGRSSIADLQVGSVVADPAAHTVAVSAGSTLQPISAKVLNAFSEVYFQYLVEVFKGMGDSEEVAKAKAAGATAGTQIASGDPLGTFAFTAQTQ